MGQDLNLRAAERPLAFEASALNRAPPPIHNPAKKEEEEGLGREWSSRNRTYASRDQNPLPYRLATDQ